FLLLRARRGRRGWGRRVGARGSTPPHPSPSRGGCFGTPLRHYHHPAPPPLRGRLGGGWPRDRASRQSPAPDPRTRTPETVSPPPAQTSPPPAPGMPQGSHPHCPALRPETADAARANPPRQWSSAP